MMNMINSLGTWINSLGTCPGRVRKLFSITWHFWFSILLLPLGSMVHAQPTVVDQHRLFYDSLLVVRLNPVGLEEQFNLAYRYRLWDDPGILFRDGHLGLGMTGAISPASARIGPKLTIKPLAVVSLSAATTISTWFGTFQNFQSYQSVQDSYSDTDREDAEDKGFNYSTYGLQVFLQAQVAAKIGPIALTNEFNAKWASWDMRDGDRGFYDSTEDIMCGREGWVLSNHTDLLFITEVGLITGVRTSVIHALYTKEHVRPGESTDTANTPIIKLGPLVAYIIDDNLSREFNKPTLLLLLQWHLKHRFRTGADVSQALPMMVLGFRWEGDLLSPD